METPKIKRPQEVASEATALYGWTDAYSALQNATKVIKEDRASLHTSLVAAVEGKKTREMQPGENRAKYLAFQRGEEHMKAKVLTIINSIFKE